MPETTTRTHSSTPISSPRSGRISACARAVARASCSSRSTRDGSGGTRSSAAGRGSSTSTRPRRCGEPVVGHVGYDWITELEPTVPLPEAGPGLPVSRFVVAETLLRFDHVGGVSEVLRGDPDEIRALLEEPVETPSATTGAPSGPLVRFPDQATHEAARAPLQGAHPRRRRLPDRPLAARASGRPRPRRSRSTGRCGGSTRRRTCSCSSSATTRWSARRRRRT